MNMAAPWQIAGNFLRKINLQRNLIKNFVVRDLRSRYVGSVMGIFWSVVHPMVLLVSYTFVFSIVLKLQPWPESGTSSFALYLFCGLLPWLFFQDAVTRACTVVVDHGRILRKTLFPTEILPIVVLLSSLVNHAIGLGALALALALLTHQLSWLVLLLPAYLVALMLFALGLGWLLASLQVFVRDTAQILSVVMIFWFWLTPIFYNETLVPPPFKTIINMNPLAHVVVAYRDCLLRRRWPDLQALVWLMVIALLMFGLGGWVFRRTKREFADVL
ncbi:MAG: ABC transporter permease [Acidobacteria bacterium]|nr:ABC transporter permease [Acidobacteriota bacterium]MBI3656676.1 ABC transporter permease [Acidobacteriota bacterium]